MANDDRDILELLKNELDFIEKGGYGRSVHNPWKPQSTFQDSLTCINYGYPYVPIRAMNAIYSISSVGAPWYRDTVRLLPRNEAGETIEDLEATDNQAKLEVSEWLRAKINELEEERATQAIAGCP